MPKACEHETPALSSFAHVQRCPGCACISISLGAVTFRVDDVGLDALWAVLGEAAEALRARRRDDVLRGLQ